MNGPSVVMTVSAWGASFVSLSEGFCNSLKAIGFNDRIIVSSDRQLKIDPSVGECRIHDVDLDFRKKYIERMVMWPDVQGRCVVHTEPDMVFMKNPLEIFGDLDRTIIISTNKFIGLLSCNFISASDYEAYREIIRDVSEWAVKTDNPRDTKAAIARFGTHPSELGFGITTGGLDEFTWAMTVSIAINRGMDVRFVNLFDYFWQPGVTSGSYRTKALGPLLEGKTFDQIRDVLLGLDRDVVENMFRTPCPVADVVGIHAPDLEKHYMKAAFEEL